MPRIKSYEHSSEYEEPKLKAKYGYTFKYFIYFKYFLVDSIEKTTELQTQDRHALLDKMQCVFVPFYKFYKFCKLGQG